MKRYATIAVGLMAGCIVLSACSSTVQVNRDEPLNNDRIFNYDQVNGKIAGSPATVVCIDGASYKGNGLHVAKDSTFLIEMSSGVRHSIATDRILKIQHIDFGAGALTGGIIGALAGLTAGFGIMTLAATTHDEGVGAGVLILGMAGAGAVIGALIGSREGSVEEFQFQKDRSFSDSTDCISPLTAVASDE